MKKMLPLFMLLFSLPSTSTVLGDLAKALPIKTFVKMPANASLAALTMAYSLMYWDDSGVWNPVAKRMEWVGGPGTCCANPAMYRLVTYTEATDAWTIANAPFSGSGHGYDGNALNPATGLHYFGQKDMNQVHTWNGTTWGVLPPLPFTAATTPALAFFPEANGGAGGLVYVGDDGRIACYNGATFQWTNITGASLSGYNMFAEYNPVRKLVWLGGGGNTAYKLGADLKLTKLNNAPFSIANSCALHSCDPVSGKFIVTNQSNNTWWEFDIAADAWTQITGLANTPNFGGACNGNGNEQFQVPIPEHGVILYFSSANNRDVYLYRHTLGTGTAAEARVSPRAATLEMSAAPQPSRGRVTLTVPFSHPGAVKIYNAQGKIVAAWSTPETPAQHLWDAAGLPAGVYLVKAVSAGETASRRIVVER